MRLAFVSISKASCLFWNFCALSASAEDVPFFYLPFGMVGYERRNIFYISSVAGLAPFDLSTFKGIHKMFRLTIGFWVVGW